MSAKKIVKFETVASVEPGPKSPKKKGRTKLTLVGPASPEISLFTSVPPSKKKARAEADAAAKTFVPKGKEKKELVRTAEWPYAKAAVVKGRGGKNGVLPGAIFGRGKDGGREGTNKSRALAALSAGKPVQIEALTEAVYGDGKGFKAHGAGMAGVLIGVSIAAVKAGKKFVKTGKGAAASYSLV